VHVGEEGEGRELWGRRSRVAAPDPRPHSIKIGCAGLQPLDTDKELTISLGMLFPSLNKLWFFDNYRGGLHPEDDNLHLRLIKIPGFDNKITRKFNGLT
jgi:hypothetical protein